MYVGDKELLIVCREEYFKILEPNEEGLFIPPAITLPVTKLTVNKIMTRF